MELYGKILTLVLALLTLACARNGVRSLLRAAEEEGDDRRRSARRNGWLWLLLGLMLLLGALYVVFRVSWLFTGAALLGGIAATYVVGAGLAGER